MRHVRLLAGAFLICGASVSGAQTDATTAPPQPAKIGGSEPFIPIGGSKKFGFDLTLLQPGSYFYDDTGDDDVGEVDLYVNGKLAISVQLAGLDLAVRLRNSAVRLGINGGTGISTATIGEYCRTALVSGECPTGETVKSETGAVLILNAGVFVQFRDLMRFEYGAIKGYSGIETASGSQRKDSARYFGISFNTKIGDVLENLIRGGT